MSMYIFIALCFGVVFGKLKDQGVFTQLNPSGNPTGVTNPLGAAFGANIYFTMINTATTTTSLYRYTPGTGSGSGSWASIPNTALPGGAVAADVENVNGFFSVFGGLSSSMTADYFTIAADSATPQWTKLEFASQPFPSPRAGHTLTLNGGLLYLIGGWTNDPPAPQYFNEMWVLDATVLAGANPRWSNPVFNAGPAPRNSHSVVSFGGELYLFGGFYHDVNAGLSVQCNLASHGCQWFNDLWKYSPTSKLWSLVNPQGALPNRRSEHSAVVVGLSMYVF